MALYGKQFSTTAFYSSTWLAWLYDKGWHNVNQGSSSNMGEIYNSNNNVLVQWSSPYIYTYYSGGTDYCRTDDSNSVLVVSSPRAFMVSYLNIGTVIGYCIGDNGNEYMFNIDRRITRGDPPRVYRYESSIVTSITINRTQFPNITSLANLVAAGDMGENTCLDPVYIAPIYQYSSPGIITIGSTRYITDGYIYLRDYTDAELEVLT